MILQELVRYYERKSRDAEGALAPEGFERKEIPFVIVLDPSGKFIQIEDTRTIEGKTKRARSFLVPQAVKRANNITANCLWDTAEYVLGVDTRGKPDRVKQQHQAFRTRVTELPQHDAGICAVSAFLVHIPLKELTQSRCWNEIKETNPNLSFQLATDTVLICERDLVVKALRTGMSSSDDRNAARGICLISGGETEIERLHPAIKGVWGAQPSGANIVSFNLRAFESYGKEEKQGENAPIGKFAAFAYTTALNHLLRRESPQRIQVGDSSVVFWAEKKDPLEDTFAIYFSEPPKDDPDANTRQVQALYRSIEQGSLNVSTEPNRFFVLGLAPNAARISVRFWLTGTVREFSARIIDHFNDLAIDHAPHEPSYLSLFRLLANTAVQGKAENIPPNLAGDTMRAILSGLPYPETLLASALRRIRAERNVSYPRAALIKACLNRSHRLKNATPEEDLRVSLDVANTSIGYRLGRLFATLEKVQEEANPGLNATIRDLFYGAASCSPVTVFATLLKLSKHHLAKIENRGRSVNLEKLIQEICEGIGPEGFPTQLALSEQGRFAIGYYHQKQSFYTKKPESAQGDPQ
jgi:CRISPR-associated protein Csd1